MMPWSELSDFDFELLNMPPSGNRQASLWLSVLVCKMQATLVNVLQWGENRGQNAQRVETSQFTSTVLF
jgi:hypothetical protein